MGNDRGWLDQVRFTTDTGCAVTLSNPNPTHSAASETGQVTVTAAAGCSWNVLTLTPWITNLVATGEGNGVVRYALATNSIPFSRSGTIVIAGQPFTIVQQGASLACAFSIWPTSVTHDWRSTTNSFSVSAWEGCEFSVFNTNPWVNIVAIRNFAGTRYVHYSLSTNNTPSARAGYIQVDAQLYYIYQSGRPPCSYSLQPLSITRPADAAAGVISVTTPFADCPWTVSTTNAWISILTSPINSGNGEVAFSISANVTQTQRTGRIQIGYQFFTITQSGGFSCISSISPGSRTHNSGAATGVVDVAIQAGCPWSVSNANAWVTILSGGSNSTGPVIYSIASNSTSVARSGNIGIAGRIFSILQSAGAETNFVALSEALDTTAPWVWTATGTLPWLGQTVVSHDGVDAVQCAASGGGDSGSGALKGGTVAAAGTLSFWWKVSSEADKDTLRFYLNGAEQARISGEVNWQQRSFPVPAGSNNFEWRYTKDASASAGQDAAWVDQVQLVHDVITSCVALSPGSRIHGYGASTNSFVVSGAATCHWTVSTTNAWISILSPSSGTGNSSILYVVASNPTASTRSGSINVGGQNFLISQSGSSGGCALSVTPTSQTHGYGSATGTLAVTVQNGCTWTVMNTNPWVSIISSRTNSGNGTVLYSIAANTNAQARTGVVRIGLQPVLLTQVGTALSGTNAPWLQFMNRTETGATLAVQGAGGKMYVVEYSVDLVHWIPISTNSAPSIITDPSAAPRRFYRTVESP